MFQQRLSVLVVVAALVCVAGAVVSIVAYDSARILTSCAQCGARLDGTLGEGRAWFADHRRQMHPDEEPAPRRSRWVRRMASL